MDVGWRTRGRDGQPCQALERWETQQQGYQQPPQQLALLGAVQYGTGKRAHGAPYEAVCQGSTALLQRQHWTVSAGWTITL